MSERVKVKAPSYFTKEERKLFKKLTKEERGHIQHMREDTARRYLVKKINEKREISTSDLRNEIKEISRKKIDDSYLSRKVDEANLHNKTFKCKFCGQGFTSEDAKTKHQKLCL